MKRFRQHIVFENVDDIARRIAYPYYDKVYYIEDVGTVDKKLIDGKKFPIYLESYLDDWNDLLFRESSKEKMQKAIDEEIKYLEKLKASLDHLNTFITVR